MPFESDTIAIEHPDLGHTVEQIDHQLATIFTSAPLRPGDFSCLLGCDQNQVVSVFDLLVECDVLLSEKMVECQRCQNLMSAAAFREAIADEEDFECSSCGRPFRRRTPVTTVYRMTAETLARPKPAVATADVESALRELDEYASVFRRMGQIWIIKYQGKMILMQDARGLSYIARLLSEQKRDVPAVCLLAAAVGIDPRVTAGTSGPMLDDDSFPIYRRRYLELMEELDAARRDNDSARIADAQEELDAFGMEIARATGLSGRKREQTDAEKVRKSVSMAVSRAIDVIKTEHPILGRHLRAFIDSGLFFRYDPERDPDWLT